jgi:hypothetical protein
MEARIHFAGFTIVATAEDCGCFVLLVCKSGLEISGVRAGWVMFTIPDRSFQ